MGAIDRGRFRIEARVRKWISLVGEEVIGAPVDMGLVVVLGKRDRGGIYEVK